MNQKPVFRQLSRGQPRHLLKFRNSFDSPFVDDEMVLNVTPPFFCFRCFIISFFSIFSIGCSKYISAVEYVRVWVCTLFVSQSIFFLIFRDILIIIRISNNKKTTPYNHFAFESEQKKDEISQAHSQFLLYIFIFIMLPHIFFSVVRLLLSSSLHSTDYSLYSSDECECASDYSIERLYTSISFLFYIFSICFQSFFSSLFLLSCIRTHTHRAPLLWLPWFCQLNANWYGTRLGRVLQLIWRQLPLLTQFAVNTRRIGWNIKYQNPLQHEFASVKQWIVYVNVIQWGGASARIKSDTFGLWRIRRHFFHGHKINSAYRHYDTHCGMLRCKIILVGKVATGSHEAPKYYFIRCSFLIYSNHPYKPGTE